MIKHPEKDAYSIFFKDIYLKRSDLNARTWVIMAKYNNVPLIINFCGSYEVAKGLLKGYSRHPKISIIMDDIFLANRMPGGITYKSFFN